MKTVMKMNFRKPKQCILSYRSYKNFENVRPIGDLRSAQSSVNVENDILKG